jgi:ABC-2 type transport system permease protein
MAGAFLAIGGFVSALTRNQVIAFVIAAAVCFLFMMSGLEMVQAAVRGWAPELVRQVVAQLSFLTHFDAITKGVLHVRDLLFFCAVMGVFLFANTVIVDLKRGA